jgi:phospholipid-binding lipoprotein MlaA
MRILTLVILSLISAYSYADDGLPSYLSEEKDATKCSDIDDPFEKVNSKIFMFNSVLDHFILRPVARGYRNALSEDTRFRVGNALSNTQVPLSTVNNVLQLEGHSALLSFWQFVINTTLGIGGLENVAKAV